MHRQKKQQMFSIPGQQLLNLKSQLVSKQNPAENKCGPQYFQVFFSSSKEQLAQELIKKQIQENTNFQASK